MLRSTILAAAYIASTAVAVASNWGGIPLPPTCDNADVKHALIDVIKRETNRTIALVGGDLQFLASTYYNLGAVTSAWRPDAEPETSIGRRRCRAMIEVALVRKPGNENNFFAIEEKIVLIEGDYRYNVQTTSGDNYVVTLSDE